MADSKSNNTQQERWREVHNFSPDVRLWVSTQGNVKCAPIIHEDVSNFRKYIVIDGRPVYIDSLELSLFSPTTNDPSVPDIKYKDGNVSNMSVDNLEWKKPVTANRQSKKKVAEELERMKYMTVTPQMVADESYFVFQDDNTKDVRLSSVNINSPIVQENSNTSVSGNENKIHNESGLSVSDIQSIHNQLTLMSEQLEKFNGRLENNTNVLAKINSLFNEDTSGHKTFAQAVADNLLNYSCLNDAIEYSLFRGRTLVKRIPVEEGYRLVSHINKNGKTEYYQVKEIAWRIAKEVTDEFNRGGDWKKILHPSPIYVTNPGYSEEEFFAEVERRCNEEIKLNPETDEQDSGSVSINMNNTINHKDEDIEKIEEKDEEIVKKTRLRATADEIIEEIKKISKEEFKTLGYKNGEWVNNGIGTGRGKPVMITDMRNMREMYCPNMKAAAELLGVSYRDIVKCVWGKKKQIGYYQVRYKYWGDALHVMSGIYKEYMDLISKRADDIESMPDEEFEKLSAQLEAMEKENRIDNKTE